jgi:hypothetical protein
MVSKFYPVLLLFFCRMMFAGKICVTLDYFIELLVLHLSRVILENKILLPVCLAIELWFMALQKMQILCLCY